MNRFRTWLAHRIYGVGCWVDPKVNLVELEKRLALRPGETWSDAVDRVNQRRS